MKNITDQTSFSDIFVGIDIKSALILLSSALLLTVHKYFGSIEFARQNLNAHSSGIPVLYMFLAAFVLLGVVPYVIIRFVFNEKLSTYGFVPGDWKFGLRSLLVLSPVILGLLLYPASQTAEMRNFYPFDRSITSLSPQFIQMQLWRGLFYYSAWEFFFRGFMLFGLREKFGDWNAIFIQTIPQCLWHIGMPTGEIFSSIAGGILFGVLALRTGSIFWPLLLHYIIGVGLDLFIVIT